MSTGNSDNTGTNWSMSAALGAAIGASACCVIPLALVSLGIGGAWIGSLTALAPYRWIFVTIAAGALSYAGYNEWRLSRRPDCDCETAFSSGTRRALLGLGTLAVAALIVSPYLIAPSPGAASEQARAAVTGDAPQEASQSASSAPVSFQQVVLEVDGMTCKACPITVRKALEDVDGVYSVEATYEPPEAIVRFNPATVSVKDLTQATKEVGYPSRRKTSS